MLGIDIFMVLPIFCKIYVAALEIYYISSSSSNYALYSLVSILSMNSLRNIQKNYLNGPEKLNIIFILFLSQS